MICRNCSAEISDNETKCPRCHKNPSERNYKGSPVAAAIILAALIALGAIVYGIMNFSAISDYIKNTPLAKQIFAQPPTLAYVDNSTTSGSTEESETTAPSVLDNIKVSVEFLTDKSGNSLAKYGYISLSKSQFTSVGGAELSEFCENAISSYELSYLTIKFENNSGIVFGGKKASSATYCTLDKNCYIETVLGTIILTQDGKYKLLEKETEPQKPTESKDKKNKDNKKDDTKTKTEKKDSKADKKTSAEKKSKDKKDSKQIVYASKSKALFHKKSCRHYKSYYTEMTKQSAAEKGYKPCQSCFD